MSIREFTIYESVLGPIFIVIENEKVCAIHIGEEDFDRKEHEETTRNNPDHFLLKEARNQFEEYFSGKRQNFNLPMELSGTSFQQSVWEQLQTIPFGKTCSYQEVATGIGNSKAVRAIGQANKANPLPILVPCHRVIGKNQSLTGYAGNRTDIKEILLTLEGAIYQK